MILVTAAPFSENNGIKIKLRPIFIIAPNIVQFKDLISCFVGIKIHCMIVEEIALKISRKHKILNEVTALK